MCLLAGLLLLPCAVLGHSGLLPAAWANPCLLACLMRPSYADHLTRPAGPVPAGLLAICCSWGSAQEAAALLQVAAAFPTSQLAEASGQWR